MMKLSKPLKIALLVLTLWPCVYVVAFMMLVMSMSAAAFPIIMVVHMTTILLVLGLMVLFIVHLFKAPQIDKFKKIMWLVLLLWGSFVVMPIYFFLYVWPDEPAPSTLG